MQKLVFFAVAFRGVVENYLEGVGVFEVFYLEDIANTTAVEVHVIGVAVLERVVGEDKVVGADLEGIAER